MIRVIFGLFFAALLSACSTVAPNYSPSVENVQNLRDSGISSVRSVKIEADAKAANNEGITLRGANMVSPVDGKYSAYVEDAMRAELRTARLLDEKSDIEISGVLMQNDVSVGSITEGTAQMEGRILVKRKGQPRYDQTKAVKFTFESSFVGAIAIPNGVKAYPELVRKFLAAIYADPEFIKALK